MVNPILDPAAQARVEQAVAAAERRTTGEIVCVLTAEVSSYPETAFAVGVLAALVGPAVALGLGFDPAWLLQLTGGWRAAHMAAASTEARTLLTLMLAVQAGLFALAAGLCALDSVRRLLTPLALKRARGRAAAYQQFLSTGLQANAERTGVVIFTSIGDRQVEIVADQIIHAACGDAVWTAAAAAVQAGMRSGDPAAGLVRAVEICGEALALHFPSPDGGENSLADRVLEL